MDSASQGTRFDGPTIASSFSFTESVISAKADSGSDDDRRHAAFQRRVHFDWNAPLECGAATVVSQSPGMFLPMLLVAIPDRAP